jgi:rare lipoprotein A
VQPLSNSGLGRNIVRLIVLAALVAPMLAACGGAGSSGVKRAAFTSKEFGVSSSPRVTKAKYPPRGGGRYLPLKPYVVRGKTYQPVDGPGYVAQGHASWYGQDFHGRRTANGEIFGAYYLTAASPVLPIPSYARVTNLENGKSVMVRVNDRGPYLQGRIIDVSYQAAEILGFRHAGSARVQVDYVGPAPLKGDDNKMLMASVNKRTRLEEDMSSRLAMAPEETDLFSGEAVEVRDGRINFADREADGYAPSRGGYSGKDFADDFFGLFGYAPGLPATAASSAADALATGAALPAAGPETDTDPRNIRLQLGVFRDGAVAAEIAVAFAALGAVDEGVTAEGDIALTLSMLKPGVAREDVVFLARELGVTDLILY